MIFSVALLLFLVVVIVRAVANGRPLVVLLGLVGVLFQLWSILSGRAATQRMPDVIQVALAVLLLLVFLRLVTRTRT